MYNYYLNIGSNLGDARTNLLRAIVALSAGTGGCGVTRMMESEPWGFESPHRFVNVGVVVRSAMEPHNMLYWLHDIERRLGSAAHRDAQGGYVDRLVDIDIMAIDDQVIDTPSSPCPTVTSLTATSSTCSCVSSTPTGRTPSPAPLSPPNKI